MANVVLMYSKIGLHQLLDPEEHRVIFPHVLTARDQGEPLRGSSEDDLPNADSTALRPDRPRERPETLDVKEVRCPEEGPHLIHLRAAVEKDAGVPVDVPDLEGYASCRASLRRPPFSRTCRTA